VKISRETVHSALDSVLDGISLSEWDRRRILQQASAPRRIPYKRLFRHFCTAAATCTFAVIFATGVLAAVPGLAEKLNMLSKETLAFFTPIEKETTASDIRVEVVAAMNDGDTAIIYVAMQDTSGQNRLDDTTWMQDISIDGIPDMMCDNVCYKPDGTVVARLVGTSDEETLSGKKVTLRLGSILSQDVRTDATDTGLTVADIIRQNPDPELGNCILPDNYGLNGSLDGPLYQILESGKLKTLKAREGRTPKDLPWVKIENAGVVDNTLHILVNPDNDKWYNSVSYFLADENGEVYPTETATVDLDMMPRTGNGVNSDYPDRQEEILQLPEGVAAKDMHIYYSADVYNFCAADAWNVTFALQQAVPGISVPCELDMEPWTATSMAISPIGITIQGHGSMTENSLSPEVRIVLKDGTVFEDYGSSTVSILSDSDNGENDQIQMKSFFNEPVDLGHVAQVSINGTVLWTADETAAAA
jgi:hypothetical protein